MSRLLLLITTNSYKANAFLGAARHLGVELTVGMEQTQALARLNPAGHLTLDFGKPDAATHRVVEHARSCPLGAVIAADDEGTVLAATVSEALGLPYSPVSAVRAARDKLLTRRKLAGAGLDGPWFESFRLDDDPADLARRVPYPCVLKPLRLAASRGVIRADDGEQFVAAWRRLGSILGSTGSREVLVESFMPGFEVALEGLLTDGKLRVLAVFDKPDPLDGPFFEETIYTTPSRHPAEIQQRIIDATQHAVTALGLTEGPVHAELRFGDDPSTRTAGPRLLEIAPRSIGGLCSRVLRFTVSRFTGSRLTGPTSRYLTLEELILRHALGYDVAGVTREAMAAGVMMIPIPRAGTLRRVDGVDEAAAVAGICDVMITLPVGQQVAPPPEGSRYLGFLFARAHEPAAVEVALRESHGRLRIDIEPRG